MADAREGRMRSVNRMVFAVHDNGQTDTRRIGIFEGAPNDRSAHANVTNITRALNTPAEQSFQQFTQNTQALDQSIQQIEHLRQIEQQQSQGMSMSLGR
jgi:hypothetical protein